MFLAFLCILLHEFFEYIFSVDLKQVIVVRSKIIYFTIVFSSANVQEVVGDFSV